jgi:phenylacetate-CoA ligase
MGRVGEAVKVRGMFVHPHQLDQVLSRFAEVRRHQAFVDRVDDRDVLLVQLEVGSDRSQEILERIADSVREVLHVRPDLELVGPGSIPDEHQRRLVDRRTWT